MLYPKPIHKIKTGYQKLQESWLKKKEGSLLKGLRVGKKGTVQAKSKRIKRPSIKTLEKKLKNIMYPYIKKRDGNKCISCGKQRLVGKDWQAGHYIKAELCNIVVRYDEWNINSQCSTCNLWKRGNTIAYRLAMLNKYGEKATNELDRKYKSSLPIDFNSREWLLNQIKKYAILK